MFWLVLKCHERLTAWRFDGFKRSRIITEENPISRQRKTEDSDSKISRRHGQNSAAVFVRAHVYAGLSSPMEQRLLKGTR